MTGTRSLSHPWGPWAGGAAERFEPSDVRAFCKLSRWGDAHVHYLARLADGAELFVNASKQDPADTKWLRKIGAECGTPNATRDCGWAIAWVAVDPCLERDGDRRPAETGCAVTQAAEPRTCGDINVGTWAALSTGMQDLCLQQRCHDSIVSARLIDNRDNWREHLWEGIVAALSWIVAIVVLAGVAVFVAIDAGKRHWLHRRRRRAQKTSALSHARLETMELAP